MFHANNTLYIPDRIEIHNVAVNSAEFPGSPLYGTCDSYFIKKANRSYKIKRKADE